MDTEIATHFCDNYIPRPFIMADAEKVASDFNTIAGRTCTLYSTHTVRHIRSYYTCVPIADLPRTTGLFSDLKEEPYIQLARIIPIKLNISKTLWR